MLSVAATIDQAADFDFYSVGTEAASRYLDRYGNELSHDAWDKLGHEHHASERPFIRTRHPAAEAADPAYEEGRTGTRQKPPRAIHPHPSIPPIALGNLPPQ